MVSLVSHHSICGDTRYDISFEMLTMLACTECLEWQTVNDLGTLCGETSLSVPVEVLAGEADTFAVSFTPSAEAAGFASAGGLTLSGGNIVLPVPVGAHPGKYSFTVSTYDSVCGEVRHDVNFEVLYPASLIAQRWNDIVFVINKEHNGGYDFVAFQWYRNGEKIEGAESSWFYEEAAFRAGDYYEVYLTSADGSEGMSCPFFVSAAQAAPASGTEYFNLQGVRLSEPPVSGVYIMLEDGEARIMHR